MSDARGRRILWRLMASTGVFGPTTMDAAALPYAEGRRSVGVEYLTFLMGQPGVMAAIIKENVATIRSGAEARPGYGSRAHLRPVPEEEQ